MDLTTLKAQIQSKNLDEFYIFTGTEIGAQDIYLAEMAKAHNGKIQRVSSLEEMAKKMHNSSIFQNAIICVLRDSKELTSNDTTQATFLSHNANKSVLRVFVYDSIDKRSKLYKSYQDHIVEFEPLRTPVLIKYIQRVIDLKDHDCEKLIDLCGSDYSRILLEVDKIKRFAEAKKSTYSDSLYALINTGAIYIPPKDAVFDFVDAVLKYKPKRAFQLLEESYASGEATLVLLSNLYNSTKQLLQVQSYQGNNLADSTGLTPFQIKLANGRKGVYRAGNLIELMRLTREAEVGIKSGTIEDSMAVVYVLTQFWG